MRGFPGLDKGKGLQLTSYYLRAQPPIIDTFPLLVYSLLLRHCAGESMSLNLGPVFVAFSDNRRSNTLPYTYASDTLSKILKDNVVFHFTTK